MNKKNILLLLSMLMHGLLFAQDFRITGKTINLKGLPISGVELSLEGHGQSTISRKDGTFFLSLPTRQKVVLKAELSGYFSAYRAVCVRTDSVYLELKLFPEVNQLGEVDVVDNVSQKRSEAESMNTMSVKRDYLIKNLGGSLMKSLERLPGIKTIGIGSGQSKPLIRGLGFNRVIVLEKGTKHEGQQWGADHGLEIDQFASGEIEIIKGAASFAYGSDAVGGIIDVKPDMVPAPHSLGGSIDPIAKSNNNALGTSFNLSGRRQNWFFSTRYTYQDYADYRVPTDSIYIYDYKVMLDHGRLRNTAGRESDIHISGGYIGKTFRSVLYASNVYSRSGFFANAHGLEPRRVDVALHDASDRDILMPSQEVNHLKLVSRSDYTVGNHAFKLDLGYQHNFRQEFSQYVNHGYMPATYPSDAASPANLERQFDKQVYSVNIKDVVSLGNHQLNFGLNGEFQDNRINGWSFLVPAFRQQSSGLFIYDKYHLNEQLIFHAALRYDYAHLKMDRYDDWFTTPVQTENGQQAQYLTRAENLSRDFNSLVYSAGINFNQDHFRLKWNIGKSFRMPIAKELAANGVNYHYFSYEKGNSILSPEVSYQTDLGLSWVFDNWSLGFSPFYNYFSNYIYLNPTPDHDYDYGAGNQIFEYTQSKVGRFGAEIELKGRIARHITAEVLGEYLYAKQLSGEKKGYVLPFSPPPSLVLSLGYTGDLSRRVHSAYFSLDYRLTAEQNNIVPPEKKTPASGVFNVQAGAKLVGKHLPISISLQVQNLLNARYLNHTSFYRLIELPEAGRNLIVSINIPFNIKIK